MELIIIILVIWNVIIKLAVQDLTRRLDSHVVHAAPGDITSIKVVDETGKETEML